LFDFSKTEQEQNPTAVIQALEALDKKLRNFAEKKYLMDTDSMGSSEIESDDSGLESRSSRVTGGSQESSGASSNDIQGLQRVSEHSEVIYDTPSRKEGVNVRASVCASAQVCYRLSFIQSAQ
jgi:hypothetical protein